MYQLKINSKVAFCHKSLKVVKRLFKLLQVRKQCCVPKHPKLYLVEPYFSHNFLKKKQQNCWHKEHPQRLLFTLVTCIQDCAILEIVPWMLNVWRWKQEKDSSDWTNCLSDLNGQFSLFFFQFSLPRHRKKLTVCDFIILGPAFNPKPQLSWASKRIKVFMGASRFFEPHNGRSSGWRWKLCVGQLKHRSFSCA